MRPASSGTIKPAKGFALTAKQEEVNKILGGPQTHSLIYGGGRSGKTFLIVRAIVTRALRAPKSLHAIVRHRFNHVVNSIGGNSGTLPRVLELCFPGLNVTVDKTRWVYTFPNGSEIWLLGLDEKNRTEKILGLEFASIYFNEGSQIKWGAVKMARSRLVQRCEIKDAPGEFLKLRAYYDLNPSGKRHWSYQQFVRKMQPDTNDVPLADPDNYVAAVMNPYDNRDNLAPEAIAELESLPESERARFLDGRYVDEVDNAMFKADWITANRSPRTPDLARLVVSVDPSGSAAGDDTGIVVAGREDDDYYVLADLSEPMNPTEAAKRAIMAYDRYSADAIVWETNYGKGWVESTLVATAREMHRRGERDTEHINLVDVTVFRGKVLRAEPVANLYELKRVHHLGIHRALEDELTSFTTNWKREVDGSPNRLDSLTMAITELQKSAPNSRSIGFGTAGGNSSSRARSAPPQ
jgi:phage terminase large subunit-like protein